MREHFRPEFLNRVDEIVLFKPLRLEEIQKIVGLLTERLRERLVGRGLQLVLDDDVVRLLAQRWVRQAT